MLSRPRHVQARRRMLDRVERWSREEPFLAPPHAGHGYHDYHAPLVSRLVRRPSLTFAACRRVVELHLHAAARASRQKSDPLATRVMVAIVLPDMFQSGIDIIFDEAYWAAYAPRDTPGQTWTRLPSGQSLLDRLRLQLPAGFREHGYQTVDRDDSLPPPYDHVEGEVWVYAEARATDA